jgi:hypothetical protein
MSTSRSITKVDVGPPDAAIRPGRRLRGRDRLHTAAIILDAIRPGQEAHDLHRLKRGSPRVDRIRTDVADRLGAQRQHAALSVETELGIDDLVEAVAGGAQVLHTVAGPFDRAAELARRRANEDLFRVERALATEAAADIGRDHTQPVTGQIERLA